MLDSARIAERLFCHSNRNSRVNKRSRIFTNRLIIQVSRYLVKIKVMEV